MCYICVVPWVTIFIVVMAMDKHSSLINHCMYVCMYVRDALNTLRSGIVESHYCASGTFNVMWGNS